MFNSRLDKKKKEKEKRDKYIFLINCALRIISLLRWIKKKLDSSLDASQL